MPLSVQTLIIRSFPRTFGAVVQLTDWEEALAGILVSDERPEVSGVPRHAAKLRDEPTKRTTEISPGKPGETSIVL